MLPRKRKHPFNAILILALIVASSSVLAKKNVTSLFLALSSTVEKSVSFVGSEISREHHSPNLKSATDVSGLSKTMALMMPTIIQGADEEVTCTNDGSTVARFNLCGDFDDRTISLSGGTGEWQQLVPTGSCTIDIADDCPSNSTDCSSSWQTVVTATTFDLVANSVSAATGEEYRVRVGGGAWHYFKVTKSTIFQDHVKTDFICGNPGQIQILGLSSGYEYNIESGSGLGPWQGPIFDNLQPGTYTVYARQQNTPDACEYRYAPIAILEQNISIDVTFVDAQCSGETGSITVIANGVPGPYKYTLLDENDTPLEFTAFLASDTHTFNAVGFGTYSVQVETQECAGDPANGVPPPTQDVDTSNNSIIIGNGLVEMQAATEVNDSFGCSNITSVDIMLTTSGGAAPYTYTVNGGPSQPSFSGSTTHTVTSAGTYDFVITDSNNCTITASSNVEDLTPPDVTATGIDGDCSNGGAQIQFNVNNANGYNLSYRVNSVDAWSTNSIISVAAGTYNDIEVRYQQGGFECTLDLPSVTVNNIGALSGSANKIADASCDGSGGTVGGQIDFGTPGGGSSSGYEFSVDGINFFSTSSFPGLIPGEYTPMVQDDGGCRLTLNPITILDTEAPTDLAFTISNVNCAANTLDVQLTPTSTNAITNYSIISPTLIDNGTNDTFVGLDASISYIFQITDSNNCTYDEGYSPSILSSIRARVRSGGNTQICDSATDGSGAFLIDGFDNNYTYNINGGAESAAQNDAEVSLTGLGAGAYTITVTDVDTGCTDSASFAVNAPTPLTLSGNITPMSCTNNNLGRVEALASGGWGAFRYTLVYPGGGTTVGPKSGPVFGNLSSSGTYTLRVEDAEGCTADHTFTLTATDAPTIALDTAASDLCYEPGSGATVVVNSTTGSAPLSSHQFRLNNGALQTSNSFAGLSPGTYSIEVVDGNNCSADISVNIRPQLRVNTSIETEIPCGGAPGQIRIMVSGGYLTGSPKTYEVSSDNGTSFATPVAFTTDNFLYDTTQDGDYIFRVTDVEGCTATSNPLTLNPQAQLNPATVDVNPVSCGASDNGVVTIRPDASSGIPPYEISFNGGSYGSQSVFSNLSVGSYPFLVRDSRGCETAPANAVVNLSSTLPPDANVSEVAASCSSGSVSGGIQINSVGNGTANFTFIVEDNSGIEITRLEAVDPATLPVQIIDPALVPDDYRIVTIDANGCTDFDTVTITSNTVQINPINHTPPVTCDDSSFTYTVEVLPVGGSYQIRLAGQGAYYNLNNNAGSNTHEFSNSADGIQYGVAYTVEVIDTVSGCEYSNVILPVEGFSALDISASSTPGFCDINRNGEISYTVSGFTLGNNLQIDLVNNDDGSISLLETVTPTGDPYSNSTQQLPGDYQVLVTNLDNSCTDAIGVVIPQNLPSIYIIEEEPANCNADGQIVVQGSGGAGGPYEFAFMNSGNTPNTGDWGSSTSFLAPAGTYDVFVRDASGCTSFAIATVIQADPILPPPSLVVDNQCAVSSPSFDIVVGVPSSVDTPRFTLGGDSQFGVLNTPGTAYEYTFTVGVPGDYLVDVTDANGCESQATATVYEFLSASGGFTTEPSCNNNDGVITILPLGGSGDFDFDLTGSDHLGSPVSISQTNNAVFTGLLPGDYEVLVTDRLVNNGVSNCTFLVDNISIAARVEPVISPTTPQNISCYGANNGSIDIILQAGTDSDGPFDYRLLDFNTRVLISNNASGTFSNLVQGSYEVEVVSSGNCNDLSGLLEINEPPIFTISASAPEFACETGSNRFSSTIVSAAITSAGTPSNYRYSITGFENYQSSPDFEIIDTGNTQNITVYAIDANGCQATASVTLNPPTDVVAAIVENDAFDCQNPERVRIEVVGTNDFTVSTQSVSPVADVTNATGTNYVDVYLPSAGDYLFEVQDNEPLGCAYPMPMYTVVAPSDPVVVINEAEPVSCFGAADGELSIEVTNYSGSYTFNVYEGSDLVKNTIVATGTLNTGNNPERITGLFGGNFYVEVTAVDAPFCSAESGIANIRTPNGSLAASAQEIGSVSCDNDGGKIVITGNGGWDTDPYSYALLRSVDGGSTYTISETAGPNPNEFENLSAGFYRAQVIDAENCLRFEDLELQPVPVINAAIREPQNLVCPNGNNAILEIYDPTTGDEISGTTGASGGLPSAGFNYRLLYLNSNDNTDIDSTSGLQNTPTFVGASGGYISAGWYAIEVSSSSNCAFVTDPYYVDPPPPIEPRLFQTRVSGCGGEGELRLFIANHDTTSNFEYEYRIIPTPDPANDPFIDFGAGVTSIFLPAPGSTSGITYQYEVRKKNAANTCLAVNSNGITMYEINSITLDANLPVSNISCAAAENGRIEAFLDGNGGIGNELYSLYIGEPIDGYTSGTAQLFRAPQSSGTFEGIPAGTDYWIGVTSGTTCDDIAGPFTISEPMPIQFTQTPSHVSCYGLSEGVITLEVTSGGVGLIKFAISPNLNTSYSDPANPGIYTFDDLAAGTYEVQVQDENGCFERETIVINEPDPIQATVLNSTPETCVGFEDGSVQLDISGGTPFIDAATSEEYYETRIIGPNSDGSEVFGRIDPLFFDNLIGGESYIIEIRDANGCPGDIVIPIEIGVDLVANARIDYGCDGMFPNNTVTIELEDLSLASDVLFALDPIDPTDAMTAMAEVEYSWGNLTAGDHTAYVYHENGCPSAVEFTIQSYEPLLLNVEKTGPNEVTATAEGGYGNYEYFFQGQSSGTINVYTTNESAVVNVEVRDEGGCVAVASIPFEFTGMLEFPDFFTPDGDVNNDVWQPENRELFPNLEVKIYDRYGRIVAHLTQVEAWDGTYEGNELPSGDYWYEVNANDKSKLRYIGHFTLYR